MPEIFHYAYRLNSAKLKYNEKIELLVREHPGSLPEGATTSGLGKIIPTAVEFLRLTALPTGGGLGAHAPGRELQLSKTDKHFRIN